MKTTVYNDLYTPEGESATGSEWNVYPRPQLVRDSFFSLNGSWDFTTGDGKWENITVPFPPESLLSGIHRHMGKRPRLIYKKDFALPEGFVRDRVILHFGAVDQIADIYVNQIHLCHHVGGYESFTVDITDALQEDNELIVRAVDDLRTPLLPYGKQTLKRGGMWYTPVSGIWQTVWLESVPERYIQKLNIENRGYTVTISTEPKMEGKVIVPELGEFTLHNGSVTITPENPLLVLFKQVIPYDYWYMYMIVPIVLVYLLIVYAPQLRQAWKARKA